MWWWWIYRRAVHSRYLVARIAKQKFYEIIKDLDKRQKFGRVVAYVYTVEFQKPRLPHIYLLFIMSPGNGIRKITQLKIDDLYSAKIRNTDDPILMTFLASKTI